MSAPTPDQMKHYRMITMAAAVMSMMACSNVPPPEPYGAIPSPAQVAWQKMETNMFIHFGPNTFTGSEWGSGKEDVEVFAPTDLDCRQWVRTARAAGMKGVIITAKHHDGFCLWPNPMSSHTVARSTWMDGKGDILRDLSEACREYGLKFGVYISPWDRNDPTYGTDGYNEVFRKTLDSALGEYGEVFEQWFDGACGEGPNGKVQVYDWDLYHRTVHRHQPDAIIFSDVGPGCRWIGNERGIAGETCWSTLDTAGFEAGRSPHRDILNTGNAGGQAWVPGEADVSIRPGWFWRESENSKVKTLSQLLEIYYGSVGRNSLLLLNVPPDTRGRIHETDSLRLMEFRSALDKIFAVDLSDGATAEASQTRGGSGKYSPANMLDDDYDSYWAADDGITASSLTFTLDGPKTFNRILLQEYIPLGQRISRFSVDVLADGRWTKAAEGTTVGYKRILLTDTVTATAVRINIEESFACPVLNGFGLFMDNMMAADGNEDGRISRRCTLMPAGRPHVLDLGQIRTVNGFFYEPGNNGQGGSIICYDLETSTDGKTWTTILKDRMFDNIVNNPVLQEVRFSSPSEARYLRLTPTRTELPDTYSIARFGAL